MFYSYMKAAQSKHVMDPFVQSLVNIPLRILQRIVDCGKLGRAMTEAVSRRPLTMEARVQSQATPCGIYGEVSCPGTDFTVST
jgi:hypothetical protein